MTTSKGVGAGLRHLLTLADLTPQSLLALLDRAQVFRAHPHNSTAFRHLLAGRAVCNLFFEPSTRTRSSFQLAAQRLGADVLHFDVATSSAGKGESDLDTLRTIEAMGVQGFVVRHPREGAVAELASHAGPSTALINAGDGRHAHPTQALLDMLTLRQAKGADFSRLRVLIVGDVRHSRVARSAVQALRILGCTGIRLCAPEPLLSNEDPLAGCEIIQDFDAAIAGVDTVMMLRLQRERMQDGLVASLDDYRLDYRLDASRLGLAAPDAVVLHPGPINREVEIASDVADGPQSLILQQVANGVAVRMAVLEALLAPGTDRAE
ncbi:MAG TPA: aspartate carbamoyltransferase catalytic subunit [Xanthomonadaceae bacterium]|nr:aspartate carbamoyltransferase catalytic subunit [Xanthomonadaceae bacterium]